MTSRATCRGTRTRGVGEEVDDVPARGVVVDDEPRDVPRHRTCGVGEEVNDERRDEPRNVPRHPNARRRKSSQQQAV
jgi:hypothetical protein